MTATRTRPTETHIPIENQTDPIPYRLAEEESAMNASKGWAIRLPKDGPNGEPRLWREPVHIAEAPHSTKPDVWPTKARAQEALDNLIEAVNDLYAPEDYQPRLVEWSEDLQAVTR
ncbi:hypothetical protein [Nocardia sp. NPDC127526]|uniref:hypothetical protein n=1 Tax=Nocardia sp. NPDC127526 TaxID=3345393 RepID=UPI0036262D1E